jgi:nicotinamidase/pyrazinamidase
MMQKSKPDLARAALIIIDVQRDFTAGGALAVPEGDLVVPPCNRLIALFAAHGRPIAVTRDWHPPDHCSFVTRGGPWPVHCVQGTRGAEFHPDLEVPADALIISKATRQDREEYSDLANPAVIQSLKSRGISVLVIGGLALDYCVKASCLDALSNGFETWLVIDATRAVNMSPDDGERTLDELAEKGVRVIRSPDLAEEAARPA